jgi:hypothetical protein
MMILPSPGGPRAVWLNSPKSLWVNLKSQEIAAMISYSSKDEDKSITGAFVEAPLPPPPPCSKTGGQGGWEEISNVNSVGGGNPDGDSGGVLT